MGKRSSFNRIERDYYPTPREAVLPLIPHLNRAKFWYTEPCAGDGRLIRHLSELTDGRAMMEYACDIDPRYPDIEKSDALSVTTASMFITNPPWDRTVLHPLITHLSSIAPTWLLFDSDWMHTKQATQFAHRLRKIVSVGRVKWIEGSNMTGKDNCCWHLFGSPDDEPTQFYGRNTSNTPTP